jgi:dTDP-4-dehydrorhamnose 3,5-epimerase
MPFHKTEFAGLIVFEPNVHKDSRGYFFESYNEKVFHQHNIDLRFVQDNQSSSCYGVIRGLHFQINPYAQTKLVRVFRGAILLIFVKILSLMVRCFLLSFLLKIKNNFLFHPDLLMDFRY